MKKLKLLLPIALVFAVPWLHETIYAHLICTWPKLSHENAHFFGFFWPLVAVGATWVWALA